MHGRNHLLLEPTLVRHFIGQIENDSLFRKKLGVRGIMLDQIDFVGGALKQSDLGGRQK